MPALTMVGPPGTRAGCHTHSSQRAGPGARTIFALVDALTRISGKLANAGDRSEADAKASALLALAA